MTRQEFLSELDGILELPPGTLQGPEKLEELKWDSTALMGFIALVDTDSGQRVAPRQTVACTTVNDLLGLAKIGM